MTTVPIPTRPHIVELRPGHPGYVTPVVLSTCCKKTFTLPDVLEMSIHSWVAGTLSQIAFPDYSPDQRELLMTGNCGPCWDMMFGEVEHLPDGVDGYGVIE